MKFRLGLLFASAPRPFDPRPDDIRWRSGSIPIGAMPTRGDVENEEAWRRYDEARRG